MSDAHNGQPVPFYLRRWFVFLLVGVVLALSISLVLVVTGKVPVQLASLLQGTTQPPASQAQTPASGEAQQRESNNQQSQTTQGPNMQVAVEPGTYNLPRLSITGDDEKFTIQRIIFNGRSNEEGCDYPDHMVARFALSGFEAAIN